jgi:hypothetical protein
MSTPESQEELLVRSKTTNFIFIIAKALSM